MARTRASGKNPLGLHIDDNEVHALTGFLDTLSTDIGRSRHMNPVMEFVFHRLDRDFDMHMTAVAPGQHARFHHVYEWGLIGVPDAKLWDTVLRGKGSSRSISFQWRASKTRVPMPDPMPEPYESEDGEVKQLDVSKAYVFVWKAPIMEYSIPVHIHPSTTQFLGFPAKGGGMRGGLNFVGDKGITVRNPGGKASTGAFTREFLDWWGGDGVDKAFESHLNQALREQVSPSKIGPKMREAFARARGGSGLSEGSKKSAIRAGAQQAQSFLRERDSYYEKAVRARQEFIRKYASGGKFNG